MSFDITPKHEQVASPTDLFIPLLEQQQNKGIKRSLLENMRNETIKAKFPTFNRKFDQQDKLENTSPNSPTRGKSNVPGNKFLSNKQQFLPEGCSSIENLKTFSEDQRYLKRESFQKQMELAFKFKERISKMQASPDNKYLALLTIQQTIILFSLDTQEQVYEFGGLHDKITMFHILKKYLATGGEDGIIKIISLDTKKVIDSFQQTQAVSTQLRMCSFIYNQQECVALCKEKDSMLTLYPIIKVSEEFSFNEANTDLNIEGRRFFRLSNDDRFIVSLYKCKVNVYNILTKERMKSYDNVQAFTITRDSKYLIMRFYNIDSLMVIDLQTWKHLSYKEIPSASLVNWQKIVVGEFRDIFNIETGEVLWARIMRENWTTVRGISEDQTLAVLENNESAIEVYDLNKREKPIHTFDDINKYRNKRKRNFFTLFQQEQPVYCDWITSGSIRVLDLESKQEAYFFRKVHTDRVRGICISGDNRFLASASLDGNIKAYDLWLRKELLFFPNAHGRQPVTGIRFSNNNKYIISEGKDDTIKIWDFPYSNPFEINFFTPVSLKYPGTLTTDPEIIGRLVKAEDRTQFLALNIDICIVPHYWSILHLLAIFEPDIISNLPSYDTENRIACLVDKYNKTPLHYLLAQKRFNSRLFSFVLTYMLDYLQDKKRTSYYELQKVIESISHLSFFIIQKTSSQLAQRYLDICFGPTQPNFGEILHLFGQAERSYEFSKVPTLSKEARRKIWSEGDDVVNFYTNLIKIDYDPTSLDMFEAVTTLKKTDDEQIFKKPLIVNLVDHLWNKTRPFMEKLALLFSLLMILISFYFGIGERTVWLEIPILILVLLFLLMEAVQIKTSGKEYLESIWNWVDIFQLVLTAFFICVRLVWEDYFPSQAWMSSLIIVLGYLRWLSYLRLFSPTRNLIEVIFQVLHDMLGFVTIVLGLLASFSFVFLEFNRSASNEPKGYISHFYSTFKLMFGDYDDSANNFSQNLILSLLRVMLNVVLLNLLISIIGNTFGRVQANRTQNDCLIRLEMIEETIILMKRFNENKSDEHRYIIYCIPDSKENELQDASLAKDVKAIRSHLPKEANNIKEYVKQINKENKRQISKMEEDMNNL